LSIYDIFLIFVLKFWKIKLEGIFGGSSLNHFPLSPNKKIKEIKWEIMLKGILNGYHHKIATPWGLKQE